MCARGQSVAIVVKCVGSGLTYALHFYDYSVSRICKSTIARVAIRQIVDQPNSRSGQSWFRET